MTASIGGRWHAIDVHVDRALARRERVTARDAALADALRVVAAAMRSGSTIQQAMARAAGRGRGRIAQACATTSSRIALGLPVEAELDRFARAVDTPAAMLFAQVVRVQHRRGGDLAAPCHRLAALLHERIRLDAEARSATAQARFSARAVMAIPLVLAAGSAWRAPDQAAAMLRPEVALVAAPGVVSILAGAIVAHRVARAARVHAMAPRAADDGGWVRRVVRAVAGTGPCSRRGARLGAVALACSVPALAQGGPATMLLAACGVGVASAWPWIDRGREHRARVAIAQAGIESLLEVSVALLVAGATAHEVATLAPASVGEPLRSALAPAVHRVGLGRTIASAFDGIPEVAASPQLDGWLHAICTSAELGAPAVEVLEHLLRDARAARREQLRTIAQTAAPRMQLALVLLVVPGVMWLMLLATVGGLLEQLRAAGVA